MEKIEFSDSVETIGISVFYGCTALRNVEFGSGLKTIGNYAFYNAESLRGVTMPDSLVSIGSYAFKGCENFNSLVLNETVEEVGAHAFYGCDYITIYTNADSIVAEWNKHWNSVYRPIVWGCTLSEDNSYVVSVTVTETTFQHVTAKGGITAPERSGYIFAGWATSPEGEVVYTAQNVAEAPVGTTLYAVWTTNV